MSYVDKASKRVGGPASDQVPQSLSALSHLEIVDLVFFRLDGGFQRLTTFVETVFEIDDPLIGRVQLFRQRIIEFRQLRRLTHLLLHQLSVFAQLQRQRFTLSARGGVS